MENGQIYRNSNNHSIMVYGKDKSIKKSLYCFLKGGKA